MLSEEEEMARKPVSGGILVEEGRIMGKLDGISRVNF